VTKILAINIKSDVLESFSKEKIMKSLKRFGITFSEIEFNKLITKSYSLEEVSSIIIEKFDPDPIIVSNLSRFIKKYWELKFPDKWPAELVIDTMNGLSMPIEQDEYMNHFKLHTDLFKYIKEINAPLQHSENLDLKILFEKSLIYWVPKFVNLFQELTCCPDNVLDIFLELRDFIKKNQAISESLHYTKELDFIKARLLYFNQNKVAAFEFLNKLQQDNVTITEILIQKSDLLLQKYDDSIAEQYYTDINKLLDSKDNIFEDEIIKDIINYLLTFQQIDRENTKKISILLEQLQQIPPIEDEATKLDNTKINEKFFGENEINDDRVDNSDEEVEKDNGYDDDVEKYKESEIRDIKNLKNLQVSFKKELAKPEIDETLNELLFSEEPIPITFECATCGLAYEQEVNKIFIPYNWGKLLQENNTIEENGLAFFDCEIKCPICSSFKFFVHISSKMLLISLEVHILNIKEKLDYNPSNTDNPIVIGNFVSKFAEESKSMRECLVKLNSLIKEDLENEEIMIAQGNALLCLNDYTEALKVFKKIVEKNEKNFEA
jgi:hypothetical protein